MKRWIAVFTLVFSTMLYSQSTQDIKVELQFYTQTYRLNEPIPVVVNVMNAGTSRFTFQVSSRIYQTFFFEIRTPANERIDVKDDFQVEMRENYSTSEDYRPMSLESGESFSRQIDITQWFDVRETGYYYIKGYFYPNPDDTNNFVESVNYKILVKPPLIVEQQVVAAEQQQQQRYDELKKLPPYDAIADMIDAKMKKDWDRFLFHIDAERLIMTFQNYAAEYSNARTGRLRLDLIEDFKDYLTKHWQDTILSYQVKRSEIEGDEAKVICDVVYKVRTLSYTLEYTFDLYRNHEGQWLVQGYVTHRIQ